MAEAETSVHDHRIETQGGALFARTWRPKHSAAAAPAILLFHDSLGCVELWRDFPARLAAHVGLPVVAYDRLGFGRSDRNPTVPAPDFMQDEARVSLPALRGRLGLERFIAFGHSVGGAMATACAAAAPDSCLAVITEAAQAFVEDRTLEGIRAAQARFAEPDQIARLARHHGDKARWVLDAWTGAWLAPAFADWSLDAHLAALQCPVLAIHGDRDEYGSILHPQRIVEKAGRGGRLVLVPDCGHVPHREAAETVLGAVGEFLNACGIGA